MSYIIIIIIVKDMRKKIIKEINFLGHDIPMFPLPFTLGYVQVTKAHSWCQKSSTVDPYIN